MKMIKKKKKNYLKKCLICDHLFLPLRHRYTFRGEDFLKKYADHGFS